MSLPSLISISLAQCLTGMDRRRFISVAVESPHSSFLEMAVGPPSSLKMSETVCMLASVLPHFRAVNIIDVDESDNLSFMSKEAGERLKEARGNRFDSAASAARHFGISASTYRAHENGQNSFNVDQCAVYADEYRVSPSWLAWGVGEKTGENANEIGGEVALQARLQFWIRGVVEGLRPEASQPAVDAMVKAATELLRNRRFASQFPSDPDQLRFLARYEAGKLLER